MQHFCYIIEYMTMNVNQKGNLRETGAFCFSFLLQSHHRCKKVLLPFCESTISLLTFLKKYGILIMTKVVIRRQTSESLS